MRIRHAQRRPFSHLQALDRIHHRTKGLSQEAREPPDCNRPRIRRGLDEDEDEGAVMPMTQGLCGGRETAEDVHVCVQVIMNTLLCGYAECLCLYGVSSLSKCKWLGTSPRCWANQCASHLVSGED